MSNADPFFNSLGYEGGKHLIKSTREKKDNADIIFLLLPFIGMLLFLGHDAVKVTMRKNFGVSLNSMIRIVLCALCFIALGLFCILTDDPDFGSAASLYISAAIYFTLAVIILERGCRQRVKTIKHQVNEMSEGQSDLLHFLKIDNWKDRQLIYIAEPLFVMALAGIISFINFYAAIPIAVCGVSVWGYKLMEFILFSNTDSRKRAEAKASQQSAEEFS